MVIDATKMSDQLNPGNINAASCWLQFVYFTVVRTDVSAGKPNDTQYLTASFNSLTGLSVSSTVNPKQPQWYVDNGGAGVQRADYAFRGPHRTGGRRTAIGDAPLVQTSVYVQTMVRTPNGS